MSDQAKQEAEALAISIAQGLVVKADDVLDGVDRSALVPAELTLLLSATGALRDLSRKLGVRHRTTRAEGSK